MDDTRTLLSIRTPISHPKLNTKTLMSNRRTGTGTQRTLVNESQMKHSLPHGQRLLSPYLFCVTVRWLFVTEWPILFLCTRSRHLKVKDTGLLFVGTNILSNCVTRRLEGRISVRASPTNHSNTQLYSGPPAKTRLTVHMQGHPIWSRSSGRSSPTPTLLKNTHFTKLLLERWINRRVAER